MRHDDDAGKGTEGSIGRGAGNVVQIDKRPLTRKDDLKRGAEEKPEHARSNVIEIGKRSFFHPMLERDTLNT